MGRVKVHAPGGESSVSVTGTYYGTGGDRKRTIDVGFRPTRLDLCGVEADNYTDAKLLLLCSTSCVEVYRDNVFVTDGLGNVRITDTGFDVNYNQYNTAYFNVVGGRYQYTAFK